MTAYLNCMNSPMGGAHSVSDSSPLQIFVIAKKKINDIFVEIDDYVRDIFTYMQSVQQDGIIVKSDDAVQVEGYIENVMAIQNILTRNHMKVSLFGRTSNGKSSVINAMLGEKILPVDCGHTTSCFLQVEGSDSGESYLVTEGSTEKQSVKSVEQLAHALSEEKLEESQLVHIYWPKDKCLLLRNEVVLVDCPGIDVTLNLDELINKYSLDADVFVIVANGESTLTLTEKNFFNKVLTRVSKPNIFILYNRWDASKSHSRDKVRAQHMEKAVEFLVTELKVCTYQEANERIFFVSAKEALQARLQEQKGLPADSGALADDFQDRYFEFQDFVRKFEEYISKSAVRTKFEQYSQRGKDIVLQIQKIIVSIYNQAWELMTQKALARKKIHDNLQHTKQELPCLKQKMNEKIQQVAEDVKQKVSRVLNEEIHHLSELVDEFNKQQFKAEQLELDEYKKKLCHHIENGFGSKLHERLSPALAMNIQKSQQEMPEQISGLLPAEKKQVLLNALPQLEPFERFYRPNSENVCADFQEDLHLKFPLKDALGVDSICSVGSVVGVSAMAQKGLYRAVSVIPTATAVAALAATTGAAILAAGAVEGLFILGRYVKKRCEWDDKAKEIEFKKQFVAHVTKEHQQIFGLISPNCSKYVEQKLSNTLERLCHLVDEAINDMDAEIKTLDKEIKQLEEAANTATKLQNKANNITELLEKFDDAFLNLHN